MQIHLNETTRRGCREVRCGGDRRLGSERLA